MQCPENKIILLTEKICAALKKGKYMICICQESKCDLQYNDVHTFSFNNYHLSNYTKTQENICAFIA